MALSIRFIAIVIIGYNTFTYAGATYYENISPVETQQTLIELETKEKEVLEALKRYKSALESKKREMIKMLKTTKGIEALMIENQIKRKKILTQWKHTNQMYTLPLQ